MKFEGIKIDNSKRVVGDYCRSDLLGCWIGCQGKSGYWESQVHADSVKEIEEEEEETE